jgi:hypothetical protein
MLVALPHTTFPLSEMLHLEFERAEYYALAEAFELSQVSENETSDL